MWAVIGVLCAAFVAHADSGELQRPADTDQDMAVAQLHYFAGVERYDHGRYAEAASEFEQANEIRALPQLSFDIARCYERLERWKKAADALEAYADSHPADEARARARIAELRARPRSRVELDDALAARPARRPVYRRWWFWTSLVGGAAVAAGLATGLTLGLRPNGAPTTTFGNTVVRF